MVALMESVMFSPPCRSRMSTSSISAPWARRRRASSMISSWRVISLLSPFKIDRKGDRLAWHRTGDPRAGDSKCSESERRDVGSRSASNLDERRHSGNQLHRFGRVGGEVSQQECRTLNLDFGQQNNIATGGIEPLFEQIARFHRRNSPAAMCRISMDTRVNEIGVGTSKVITLRRPCGGGRRTPARRRGSAPRAGRPPAGPAPPATPPPASAPPAPSPRWRPPRGTARP